MPKNEVITLRLEKSLGDELSHVASELGFTRADYIRFVLKASTMLDKRALRLSIESAFSNHLNTGMHQRKKPSVERQMD